MSAKLDNDHLLRALKRQPVDMTPVWIMRQAGRYLPEYRATRQRAGDFLTLCKTPELACEVTLQPLQRFNLDAAILFSDILTVPDAMGLGLQIVENQGPRFSNPVRTEKEIKKLSKPDVDSDLSYVMDAVSLIKRELNNKVPLIGFSGSPWTVATYMIEGGASKEFSLAKGMLYKEPLLLHHLLEVLSQSVTDYLNGQIHAGVDVVMIFDTWGGILSYEAYKEFSLNYMHEIIAGLDNKSRGKDVPVVLFTKGGAGWAEDVIKSGCDAIGVDWTVDIGTVRKKLNGKVALQGNLDTAALYSTPDVIQQHVEKVLASYGSGTGHVFNLGHGIHPGIDPDNVAVLVDAVHEFSKKYHTVER